MRAGWVDRITVWNHHGIQWRQFRAVELLWMEHRETFEYLKREHPSRVREYLLSVGDLTLLGQWDAGRFKETDLSTGGAS